MGAKVKEVACVYCDKKIMSRHFETYVCNECFIQGMNKG